MGHPISVNLEPLFLHPFRVSRIVQTDNEHSKQTQKKPIKGKPPTSASAVRGCQAAKRHLDARPRPAHRSALSDARPRATRRRTPWARKYHVRRRRDYPQSPRVFAVHRPSTWDVAVEGPNALGAGARGRKQTPDWRLTPTRAPHRDNPVHLGPRLSARIRELRVHVPLMKYSLAPSLALASCSCMMNAPSGGKTSFESPFEKC